MVKASTQTGVIVPVYNRLESVWDSLNSVLAQTLLPRRLIIVDDGSDNENTAKYIETWLADNRRQDIEIEFIRSPNGGVSRARNLGLQRMLDCEFVLFLDSDDCLPDDFLERTAAKMTRDPYACAASTGRYLHREGDDKCSSNFFYRDHLISLNAISWFFLFDPGICSSTLFRTRALIEAGGFDECLYTGQDVDLFVRIAVQNNNRWLFCTGKTVEISRHDKQRVDDSPQQKTFDAPRRWAFIYERLYIQFAAQTDRQTRKDMRYGLAMRWFSAGNKLTLDRLEIATQLSGVYILKMRLKCLFKSFRCKPLWTLRTLLLNSSNG